MTATRTSRESVETLIQSDGELWVSRGSVEALIQTIVALQVSRVAVEVLVREQAGVEGVLFSAPPTFFSGQVSLDVIITGTLFTKSPVFPSGSVTAPLAASMQGWGIPIGIP